MDTDFNLTLEKLQKRKEKPQLPKTVTKLETEDGCKVYLVGTAHFSMNSRIDVAKTIQEVQPDAVVVELCKERSFLLNLDEKTLLQGFKKLSFIALAATMREFGVISGIIMLMVYTMESYLMQGLEIVSGGEMKEAYYQFLKVPLCKFFLGDRPISITIRRAKAAVSFCETLKLVASLLSCIFCTAWLFGWLKFSIKKKPNTVKLKRAGVEPKFVELIETAKDRAFMEQMFSFLQEHLPGIYNTLIKERDMYLTKFLREVAKPLKLQHSLQTEPLYLPSVVVGVVGIGHVPGIVKNWNKQLEIKELLSVPTSHSIRSKVLQRAFVLILTIVTIYFIYVTGTILVSLVVSSATWLHYLCQCVLGIF
nr:PREDICTED: traB domain-containing protein-like [Latimeria chalumnae]|eukprot:XP_005994315.1 PREDICTED: traB domain-containing protein-like [Latimeria chalumnae]